jgi:hypothetical protein
MYKEMDHTLRQTLDLPCLPRGTLPICHGFASRSGEYELAK